MHDVQHVQQLALVLVEALDLHVQHGVRVDVDPAVRLDPVGQALLVGELGGRKFLQECRLVREFLQLGQLAEVLAPVGADRLVDEGRQRPVGVGQPAARRDAVGDVDEAAREQLGEVGKDGVDQQLAVQLGHAIDLVAGQHAHVGHAHAALAGLVDQRHATQQVVVLAVVGAHPVQEALVDLEDDLEVARQHAAHHGHRPGLQRFGHQRVVGVGEHLAALGPGAVPRHLVVVHQDAHQLGHGDGRVGVVQVDGHLIGQLGEVLVVVQVAADDVLQRGADEEVLLAQTQLAALVAGIIRIQHARDVFRLVLAGHGLHVVALREQGQVQALGGAGMPQPHGVDGLGVIAGHDHVVSRGHDLLGLVPEGTALGVVLDPATELDGEGDLRTGEFPRVAQLEPVIGLLDLVTVVDRLGEHAVVVADAVAEAGQTGGGHRIQEAGSQAAQAAVAQTRIGFFLAGLFQIDAAFGQGRGQLVVQVDGHQAVGQRATDQEFHREVVDALDLLAILLARGLDPVLDLLVTSQAGQRGVPVCLRGGLRILADGVEEAVGHVAAQGLVVIPFDRGRLEGFGQRGGILGLLGGLGGHLHDLSVK